MTLDDDVERFVQDEIHKFISAGLTIGDYRAFTTLRNEFRKSCPTLEEYISLVNDARRYSALHN